MFAPGAAVWGELRIERVPLCLISLEAPSLKRDGDPHALYAPKVKKDCQW
jgi:hypothetical protein